MSARGHRIISGLLAAHACGRPHGLPVSKLRGIKRVGQKYELAFGKALQDHYGKRATVQLGQWFVFIDANGHGYCQPDVLLHIGSEVVIFECKLTDTDMAASQLSFLYKPVVERVYGLPVRRVIVTRHLTKTSDTSAVGYDLKGVLAASMKIIPILHWRERSPL